MGDKPFVAFMDAFGRDHAGKPVSTEEFLAAAEKAHGKPLGAEVRDLITRAAEPQTPSWSVDAFNVELDRTLIVDRHPQGRRRPARGGRAAPAADRAAVAQHLCADQDR